MDQQPNPKFLERMKLYEDTIACRRTDRVLAAPFPIYLPINLYGGVTVKDVMQNYEAYLPQYIRYHEEFQPDLQWGPQAIFPAAGIRHLDPTFIKIPGIHLPDNAPFQVLDPEDGYMTGEEYLEYAEDPTGFIIRKILPRHYKNLAGLEMVDLHNAVWQEGMYSMIPFALPPVQQAFEAMGKAGAEMMKLSDAGGKMCGILAGMGWPTAIDNSILAPFDLFNDVLRGLLNTTMDLLEYPDELLEALKTSTKMQIRSIKNVFKRMPFAKSIVFFCHNGMDSFMSREQFETFYWPGLLECIKTVIDCGGIPHIYLEDCYDMKMDIIARDLPANKCIVSITNCNMERTKELFADKICISGCVDGTLLMHGTKEQVIADVKNKIDILAPGGGYFLDTDVSLDVAKPENLHALFDTARSYMKY